MDINQNKSEFMNLMVEFKSEIEKALDKNIYDKEVEKLREDYKGKISKERFKNYLVTKTALHITFKYIFIRMGSELQNIVAPKFNEEGITNWNEMSKNYRQDYYMLFRFASNDLRRTEEMGNFFEHCIYDDFIPKLQSFFNKKEENYIEKLKHYDFNTFNQNIAISLFDLLYPGDDKEKLHGFLYESKIVNKLMESLGLL